MSPARAVPEAERLRREGRFATAEALLRQALESAPGDREQLYLLGRVLLDEHRYGEAALTFRNIDTQDLSATRQALVLIGLGRALAGQGEPGKAAERFLKARALADPGAEALAQLALARQDQGDLPGAARRWSEYRALRPEVGSAARYQQRVAYLSERIRRLRRLRESGAGDRRSAIELALLLEESGDPAGAVAVLGDVPAAPGGLGGEPRYLSARLLLALGRLREARQALRDHLADFPHHLGGYYALAAVEAAAGDRAAEARAWDGALAVRPDDRFAARGRYRALALDGSLDAEIRALQRELAETPSAGGHVRLALALEAAERPDEALEHLIRALERAPNDPQVLEPLRDHLEGRPSRVLRAAASLTDRARTRPAALRARGVLRAAFGDAAGARDDLEEFLRRFPEDLRGKVCLAFARQTAGDRPAARRLLEEAVEEGPAYAQAHLDLAALALQQGDAGRALAEARAAGRLRPLEPLSHTLAGAALLDSGDVRAALVELGQALALAPADPSGHILPLALRAFLQLGQPESVRVFLRGGVPLEPERLYDLAWRHLRDTYVGAGEAEAPDWGVWRHRFRGRLRTAADAHAAIGQMAASLDDRYTRLLSRRQSLERLLEDGEVLASGPKESTEQAPTLYWSVQEEGGIYLRLTSLRDPAAAKAVEKVLDSFPEVDDVVLDLRGNPGGYEDQARKIAELLLPEGKTTARWRTRGGVEPPGRGHPSQARVEVLVDRDTGSAAEHLAEDLAGGGAARVIGGPTVGKRAAQIPFLLPDGWTLLVTAARLEPVEVDAAGRP